VSSRNECLKKITQSTQRYNQVILQAQASRQKGLLSERCPWADYNTDRAEEILCWNGRTCPGINSFFTDVASLGEWLRKLLLKKANIKSRLGIARSHVTKPETFWKKMLCSTELWPEKNVLCLAQTKHTPTPWKIKKETFVAS